MTPKRWNGSGSAANGLRDFALVALLSSCGFAVSVSAAPVAGQAVRYRFNQPAQPLGETLREIGLRTGTSVLFDGIKLEGMKSRPVMGDLTAPEALSRAIEGSGLEMVEEADGSISLRMPATPRAAASAPHGGASPPGPPGASGATDIRAHVAQSDSGSGIAADSAGDAEGRKQTTDDATVLGKVEVTGSRIKRIDVEGATPVNVYTRKDIEKSGQPTLERFLGTLNETSVGSGEGNLGQTFGQGTVQLRGLPLGSTLVLINGRRVQAVGSSSGNYFNLNLIPTAAVERIEIVPVGSSAVYGGDALAGVVNIILKKSMDGYLLDARLASASGTRDGGISFGTGGQTSAGSFLVLGSYSKGTPLHATDRAFFRDGDYRRFGGVDARTRSCTPGTVSSTTSANLAGLSSSFAGIPGSSTGQTLTVGDFAATAGQANLCNPLANGNGTALLYGSENFALHATGQHRLTDTWDVFGEMSFDRERTAAEMAGFQLNNVLVPATNPFNPFGTAVRVTARLGEQNGAETFARSTDFKRMLLGLRGEVGAGWDAELAVSTTRDDGVRHQIGTATTTALNAALAASNPAAALNPFTSGLAASDEVVKGIWKDAPRFNHGRKEQASGFVRGSLLTLPTGKVDVIAGAETMRDYYEVAQPGTSTIEGSRSSTAVYGELRVPLWRASSGSLGAVDGLGAAAAAPSGGGREVAALTLAGRRDHYDDFGSANTYQTGLELRPVKSLLIRGSAATSFKPPTLLQTNVDNTTFTSETIGMVDPARGGAPVIGGTILRTTNPNLHPEQGRATSLGAVWEPEGTIGTRVAATAWRVKINGLISLLWPQTALDNEALFPGLVTRGPSSGGLPGPVTQVLYTEVNFGSVNTAGADLELTHGWKTAGGTWTASASATRTTRYDVVIAPGTPVDHRLGHRAVDYWSPKWKGRLALGFDRGPWSLGLTSRYLGAYQDMAPGKQSLGNFWMHDLAASIDLKKMGLDLHGAKGATLSVGIANLANRLPEYVSTYPYYDVTQADWRGRYASAHLSVTF